MKIKFDMRYLPPLILVFLGLLIFTALLKPPTSGFGSNPLVGKTLPSFETVSFDGQTVTTEDLKGRPVLINFFASWCAPCRIEHPVLMMAQQNKSVRVIGVLYGQDPNLNAFLAENGNPYEMILRDPGGRLALMFGVGGIPETFALNKDGIVKAHQASVISADDLNDILEDIGATP